jgi:Ca-activated chloride channel family protein
MESFFDRVPIEEFRVSVVAVYNGAKPVVVDTKDFEVVRNILGDLPMHYAFPSGKTKLFDGLEEAAKMASPGIRAARRVVVSRDGDTVPATGMPRMPDSVRSVLVVGVGDARTGKFIDGRQSRQDVPTLRQIAARLCRAFHDGTRSSSPPRSSSTRRGSRRRTSSRSSRGASTRLIAAIAGAAILGALPMLLTAFGTRWRPGRSSARAGSGTAARSRRERAAAAS